MEWPTCENCRYDVSGKCGYQPLHPWVKTPPADVACYGCCGYWHGVDGSTIRERCREVASALSGTRPPSDSMPVQDSNSPRSVQLDRAT